MQVYQIKMPVAPHLREAQRRRKARRSATDEAARRRAPECALPSGLPGCSASPMLPPELPRPVAAGSTRRRSRRSGSYSAGGAHCLGPSQVFFPCRPDGGGSLPRAWRRYSQRRLSFMGEVGLRQVRRGFAAVSSPYSFRRSGLRPSSQPILGGGFHCRPGGPRPWSFAAGSGRYTIFYLPV